MKAWLKERWELIVGIFIGILGALAIVFKPNMAKKILEGKDDLNKGTRDILESENIDLVDKIESANEKYDNAIKKTEEDRDNRLAELDKTSNEREKDLEGLSPEELAQELEKVIKQSIIDNG